MIVETIGNHNIELGCLDRVSLGERGHLLTLKSNHAVGAEPNNCVTSLLG